VPPGARAGQPGGPRQLISRIRRLARLTSRNRPYHPGRAAPAAAKTAPNSDQRPSAKPRLTLGSSPSLPEICGFHETRQGTRFTISPQAQEDVLDKLLALNFYRHEQEVRQGLHGSKKIRKPAGAPPENSLF